jgi:hypothetical protein
MLNTIWSELAIRRLENLKFYLEEG